MKIQVYISLLLGISLLSCQQEKQNAITSLSNHQGNEAYSVINYGAKIGYLKTETSGDTIHVDFDYKNNGRGPSLKETLVLNTEGLPLSWNIEGNTTFGNQVNEQFEYENKWARWTDATGSDSLKTTSPPFYSNQNGSPYSMLLMARHLLRQKDQKAPVLPQGTISLQKIEPIQLEGDTTHLKLAAYSISGNSMNPSYFVMDDQQNLFATISSHTVIIKEGYEDFTQKMIDLSETYEAQRFTDLQKSYAHNYPKKVRIKQVKIFDPQTLNLSNMVSVVVEGDKILSIDAPETVRENEVVIDGNGGTLIPGMYDMHAHTGERQGLLNLLAGVTSFRDMGNHNDVLTNLMVKIDSGLLAGPRIHRLGFIEGKSPYNSNGGILVSSLEEALEAIDTYHNQGFYGIKLYNSMNGDWAPELVKKAHEYDMFVCGHVPAFSNANAMLNAGFDEMTHINQTMLGWVLEPDEDTRTLLRLTAMKRFPQIDLNSEQVQETISLFIKNNTAIDPTLAIHEALLLGRNGSISPGTVDFISHLPPAEQRSYKVAWSEVTNSEDDEAYKGAFKKIIETLTLMKDKGIQIIPGTDMGGSFFFHRELELYQQLGFTPAELLKLATYDMAAYLGDKNLGSIKPGYLADFFLVPGNPVEDLKAIKTVSMVSKGGTFYYPKEIYPSFGIEPFTDMPSVKE